MTSRIQIEMNGETVVAEEFIAVTGSENGDASIFYNADALTLGMAVKMVAVAYGEAMAALNDEERGLIREILGEMPCEE